MLWPISSSAKKNEKKALFLEQATNFIRRILRRLMGRYVYWDGRNEGQEIKGLHKYLLARRAQRDILVRRGAVLVILGGLRRPN